MFTANATSALPFGSIAIYQISMRTENLVLAILSWVSARHTHNVLSKLSDNQLADIGLSRSDIAQGLVRRSL